ncbi:MAG: NfeD family protein [Veillonella sp.]|nr:NfeD family protein [Veillonella sp.]
MDDMWLMIGGLVLLGLETLVPGGIVGFIGYLLFVWGLYGFVGGGMVGCAWVLGLSLVLGLLALWVINQFPQSWLGRRLTLTKQSTTEAGYVSNEIHTDLQGKEGIAQSPLRPSGLVRIGDDFVDVVTDGEYIEKGQAVVVHKVVGSRIIVRPCPPRQ